jgi:hypothetical protein
VLNVSPKYRKALNANQVGLLKLVYKFRFVNTSLLAEVVGKDKSSVYENLYVLVNQEYITKRYDKTYRLRGRPASYCLATKGIRYLRENTKASHKALKNMYKNKRMGEEYIDHCLLAMRISTTLKKQTNGVFSIYSRFELSDYDFFIKPLPDLYLRRDKPKADHQFNYNLDIFDPNLPFWMFRKRISAYQDHRFMVELADGQTYPYVLLVAPNERTEKRLRHYIENIYSIVEIYTTTTDRLLNPDDVHKAVWRGSFDQDEDGTPTFRGL